MPSSLPPSTQVSQSTGVPSSIRAPSPFHYQNWAVLMYWGTVMLISRSSHHSPPFLVSNTWGFYYIGCTAIAPPRSGQKQCIARGLEAPEVLQHAGSVADSTIKSQLSHCMPTGLRHPRDFANYGLLIPIISLQSQCPPVSNPPSPTTPSEAPVSTKYHTQVLGLKPMAPPSPARRSPRTHFPGTYRSIST